MNAGRGFGRICVGAAALLLIGLPLVASAATQSVSIKAAPTCGSSSYCYTPGTVNAKVGDKITWTNVSSATHTVTRCTASACSGNGGGNGGQSGPSSPQIASGGTFSVTFTKPGTYLYYCQIHGYSVMHATVHVAAASTPAPSTPAPTTAPTAKPGTATATPAATAGVAAAQATPANSLPHSGRDLRPFVFSAVMLVEIGVALMLVSAGKRVGHR